MIRRGKNCAYAIFLGFSILCHSTGAFARGEEKALKASPANTTSAFHWADHSKLSWDDFKGGINTDEDEVAAATHCGIGFRTTSPATTNDKPGIEVYNLFYANKSWVKPDAKMPEILAHEQGHFDLCEIYTRKLRARLSKFDLPENPQEFTMQIKSELVAIYNDVSNEYELRQQAYEQETIHGTDIAAQKKWITLIAQELDAEEIAP